MKLQNGTKKTRQIWTDFKKFISRGSVVDMAIGVIMGSAFGAIVTAVVNILLSLCTWGVPGGINGLITVLPAINDAQAGVAGIGQTFADTDLASMAEIYAKNNNLTIDTSSATDLINVENTLKGLYTLHGTTYFYNQSALINWGSLITAAIDFLIIALVLFTILKIFSYLKNRKAQFEAKELEKYYRANPSERPAPVVPGKPAVTEIDLLTEIRDQLKTQNETKKPKKE
jgi:Large-conductance mechanosensitive channel